VESALTTSHSNISQIDDAPASENVSPATSEASHPYIGRWNSLVSTTNWEKGRIISDWRETLKEAGAPVSAWSDEGWSRLVGGVTGQHAGRLRRVYQRFGASSSSFKGLYWSHFHAAVEWEDAEMWLEGAVQNGWSVASMQRERWSVLSPNEAPPAAEEAIAGELDEDFEPARSEPPHATSDDDSGGVEAASANNDEPEAGVVGEGDLKSSNDHEDAGDEQEKAAPIKPFENLGDLPPDMHDAFEMFKLSILRHKMNEWSEVSLDDVLKALDGLKTLATAPN
jgi:hypothetical protein